MVSWTEKLRALCILSIDKLVIRPILIGEGMCSSWAFPYPFLANTGRRSG